MEILQWELIKQKRPVQSVGASDLDTSSMILDNTSLDAPFFHHSSIPFLKTLWGKNDRIEHQLMEPMEPIKTVSLSQNPYKGPSLDSQLYSMPENQWVDRREVPIGPLSDSVPERYSGPTYHAYQPIEYREPHYNDYYQRFGNYSSNNYNPPGYGSQNAW